MNLSGAVSARVEELLRDRGITQYKLSRLSGVPQATISDIRLKKNKSVNLKIIYELADGLGYGLDEFFNSPLFRRENLD